jgi:hypothetical protein
MNKKWKEIHSCHGHWQEPRNPRNSIGMRMAIKW